MRANTLANITRPPAPVKLNSEPSSPRSVTAFVRASGGRVSYRQIDYWCRAGWIRLESEAHGSGSRRVFTDAEWAAALLLLDELDVIHARFEHIQSGKFFKEALDAAQG